MLLFFRLGATNAWRNLTRSALAILSMALAAAFLTNAISLSRGYPRLYRSEYRLVLGGEVAVYDLAFDGEVPAGDSSWAFQRLSSSPFTDLDVFFPELQQGYLSDVEQVQPFSDELLERIANVDGVRAIYPRYQMPAESFYLNSQRSTPLRGRDATSDLPLLEMANQASSGLRLDGRWFGAEDEGRMVAVISDVQHGPESFSAAPVGGKLQLRLPRLTMIDDRVAVDYQDCLEVELEVIGVVEITTRSVSTYIEMPSGETVETKTPLHWQLDEIQIPLSTWQMLWQQVADFEYQPRQLMLQIDDMAYIEDQMLALRSQFPDQTFVSVVDIAQKAETQLLIEDYQQLPATAYAAVMRQFSEAEQTAMPMDMRGPLSLLIFLNASLVIAANLLIMINERKVEIGILKSVGALKQNIVTMALAEAVLIAGLGAVGGFAVIRVPAILNQLTNQTPLTSILASVGGDFLLVIGIAFFSSVAFGLLPALRMAGLSVNEVLRNE